jgi:hypothetical protein
MTQQDHRHHLPRHHLATSSRTFIDFKPSKKKRERSNVRNRSILKKSSCCHRSAYVFDAQPPAGTTFQTCVSNFESSLLGVSVSVVMMSVSLLSVSVMFKLSRHLDAIQKRACFGRRRVMLETRVTWRDCSRVVIVHKKRVSFFTFYHFKIGFPHKTNNRPW